MALEKAKELENGVVTNYHRIVEYQLDYKQAKLSVKVASYVSEAQRLTEKAEFDEVEELNAKRTELDALLENPTKENEAERQSLSDEINAMVADGEPIPKERHVATTDYSENIDVSNDYTREDLYALLTSTGYEFEGAAEV